MLNGYDVSEFQGQIDFNVARPDFLVIRDVYSTTHIDAQFARNLANARAAGIPRWCYSFVEPAVTDPRSAADYTVRAHDAYQPGEGQACDVERDIGPALVGWVLQWHQWFHSATGIIAVTYLNRYLLGAYDWSPVIAFGSGLWLAVGDGDPNNYAFDLHGWPVLAMKQWRLDGPPAPGIGANLDYDTFNGDVSAFRAYGASGTIVVPPTPVPTPPPPQPPDAGFPYAIVSGDTLSGIAARCGIGWRDLWNYDGNRAVIANPDLIYAGQVIRVPCQSSPTPSPQPSSCEYAVRPGDTLSGIAAACGMNWVDLWNYDGNRQRIDNPNLIYTGQVIMIPC